MSWINDVIHSNQYESWLRGQYEPDEKLFVGRSQKRETPTWMLKGADRPHPSEAELEARGDEYLRKHGIQ